ncbi:MAG TPA: ABC transporter substrate-binding protein [Acidimicrobiales bacterium]|nr:ABC transporter substrate-binding protein [Acidimicrobiales bacterium]
MTRSRGWVWLVAAGLIAGVVLVSFIARVVIQLLPADTRDNVRKAVRANAWPLGGGVGVLIATIVFALCSTGLPVISRPAASSAQSVAAADTTDTGDLPVDTTLAGAAGGPASATPAGAVSAKRAAAAAGGARLASLYSGAADLQGITDDSITVCGHAPLSLGALLNTKAEDILVYWRYINDKGGINGRKINVSLEDDQYSASGGVPAAQRCAERNPFFIFGSVGSDVVPPVREWAEQNRQLYFYSFSPRAGTEKLKYSYTATISLEDLSTVIGRLATTKFGAKKSKVGVLWRNSSNVQPGRDAFKAEVARNGGKLVADLPVTQSQGNYSQEIIELQNRGAEVVVILDDALAQINIMKQGKSQNYNPQWLVFAFNVQTQTLGEDSLHPPLAGTNLAPAYQCHTFDGPYASYAADIREFEAAYAKFSPDTDLCGLGGDIAWDTWVGFKAAGAIIEACGRDCSRNKFAGLLDNGYNAKIGAACPVDFRGDPHHGGLYADYFEAYRLPNGKPGWRNPERCLRAKP